MDQYKKDPGQSGYPQQDPRQQYPPNPTPPYGEPPRKETCPDPLPPPPTPDPCKGVDPPSEPGCPPPKAPSDKDCTPKDPCDGCKDDCEDPCACADRPCGLPGLEGTIRQQLTALEAVLALPADPVIAAATTVLDADLKELTTEYAGVPDAVSKFEAKRAEIECTFSQKARVWFNKIHELCDSCMRCEATLEDIQEAYRRSKEEEHKICCEYIHQRYDLRRMQNCQEQSVSREVEAKADLVTLQKLAADFEARLKELETLYNDAVAAADKRNFKRVCALKLEFDGRWYTLFQAETWCFKRKDCCICCPPCELLPNTLPCWTVERYRNELQKAIKVLIAAKYNRYLWQAYWLREEDRYKRLKDKCEKTHTSRKDRFLAEAEEARDCPAPTNDPGDCGCGGQQRKGA